MVVLFVVVLSTILPEISPVACGGSLQGERVRLSAGGGVVAGELQQARAGLIDHTAARAGTGAEVDDLRNWIHPHRCK